VIGIRTDELDDFPVTLNGLLPITSRLINHAEPVVAVMHVGEALQEIVCRALGLIELAGLDQIDGGIGGSRQLFLPQKKGFFALEEGIELFALFSFACGGTGKRVALGRLILL
jgi:hypothetical protein